MTVMDPVAFASFGRTIKPMLAQPPKQGVKITDPQFKGWIFDHKLDGIRCLAFWDGSQVTLVNRSGVDMTNRYPDLEAAFGLSGLPACILDGEIVANSGSFQDTQKRDKQNKAADVAAVLASHPVTFITFDLLYVYDQDVRNTPYATRREALERLIISVRPQKIVVSVASNDPGYFEIVKSMGLEGVIAKDPRSTYRAGRFSSWTKFKAVRSITALGLGYDLGEGARAHFGAMFLYLLHPTDPQPVAIGRVGTGFTKATIDHLKGELDAGRPVLCEIECLNKSKDGLLRFPVYKGLRTDLTVLDARLSQLDDIPTM